MNAKKQQQYFARLDRAVKVHHARSIGPEAASKVEIEVAGSILGYEVSSDTCQRGLRPFEAAEFVASALEGAVQGLAVERGRVPPPLGKYSPLHSTDAIFRVIWKLRELIDRLGIPYELYVAYAMDYLGKRTTRLPRPGQLLMPDVVSEVMRRWLAHQAQQKAGQMMSEQSSSESYPFD